MSGELASLSMNRIFFVLGLLFVSKAVFAGGDMFRGAERITAIRPTGGDNFEIQTVVGTESKIEMEISSPAKCVVAKASNNYFCCRADLEKQTRLEYKVNSPPVVEFSETLDKNHNYSLKRGQGTNFFLATDYDPRICEKSEEELEEEYAADLFKSAQKVVAIRSKGGDNFEVQTVDELDSKVVAAFTSPARCLVAKWSKDYYCCTSDPERKTKFIDYFGRTPLTKMVKTMAQNHNYRRGVAQGISKYSVESYDPSKCVEPRKSE